MNKFELEKKIYSDKTIKKIEKKIRLLGTSCKYNAYELMDIRIIISIALFIICLFVFKYGYFVAPVVSIGFYILFEYCMLDEKIKKREKKLEGEAIYFFEVLTLSLDTGRNLEEAIRVTVNNVDGDLSLEFKEVLKNIGFGKSLDEALKDLEKVIPSNNINNVILSLIESSVYGNGIIDNLNRQVDYMREKRIMEVKAVISKIPIKISVVSVLFFVPIILIIILAPVLLEYIVG